MFLRFFIFISLQRLRLRKASLYEEMLSEFADFWSGKGRAIVLRKWREKYGELMEEEEEEEIDLESAVDSYVKEVVGPKVEEERRRREEEAAERERRRREKKGRKKKEEKEVSEYD